MKTKNKNIIVGILIVMLSFILMNEGLQTCDDFGYSLHCGTKEPIQGLWHILDSQVVHYQEVNGRFFLHCIVQIFATYGKGLPYIWGINAFVFAGLLVGLHKISGHNSRRQFYSVASIYAASIILFFPTLGATYLGNIACSVNYLWTSCAIVWFIYLYDCLSDRNCSAMQKIALFFLSAVIGSLQEAFSIGLAGALCLNWLLNRKSVSSSQFLMTVGFCIGTTILCLAPGNFSRVGVIEAPEIMQQFIVILRKVFILPATVCFICFCYMRNKIKTIHFVRNNGVLLLAILISFAFSTLFYKGPHQLTSIALFCLVVLSRWTYDISPKIEKLYRFVCLCLIVVFFIPAYYYRKELKKAHDEMINLKYDYIMSADYDKLMYSDTSYLMRFVTHRYNYGAFSPIIFSKWAGVSPELSLRLPQTKEYIIKTCENNNKYAEGIYHCSSDVFWVVRVSRNSDLNKIGVEVTSMEGMLIVKRMLGYKPAKKVTSKRYVELPHFISGDFVYAVVMSDAHAPVEEIKLK